MDGSTCKLAEVYIAEYVNKEFILTIKLTKAVGFQLMNANKSADKYDFSNNAILYHTVQMYNS